VIHVDRSAVPEPGRLAAIRRKGYLHAKAFFQSPVAERRQVNYYNPYWDKAYFVPVRALVQLFHEKCAFCESGIPDLRVRGVVDHLRPKWGTRGLGQEYANDHYWWLAYVWSNLYLTCVECNKQRGPRFPVDGARVSGPGVDETIEKPLLLDPCHDDPAEHLRFDASGVVKPLTHKGANSIELWGLNRPALLRRRAALGRELRRLMQGLETGRRRGRHRQLAPVIERLNAAVEPGAEFRGFASQVIGRVKGGTTKLPGLHIQRKSGRGARRAVVKRRAPVTPRYLHEVRIRNFRGIGDLRLILPSSEHRPMDWLMLIGENAAGKSSVLQALCLTLLGQAERDRLRLDARDFVKRGTGAGFVELRFRDGGPPRRLRFRRSSRAFDCSDAAAAAPTMAYGATRLAPGPGMTPGEAVAGNLFNPFAPLTDAKAWLRKLTRAQFDYAARALKSLMALEQRTVRFRRSQAGILVRIFGAEVSLEQLSDGYQSVISLAADLMDTIQRDFHGGMETAEGIVLLDELGAHLHPRWKMRIARALRQAFPRLQFVVTTHDPLCLRGLRNGETTVIERTARGRVFARTDLPPIEGMRVDQILQSEFFGLRSAMDPDVERDFDRMYALKARPRLTPAQQKQLAGLEAKLVDYEVLGSTRSERLMLSEINRFLAREEEEPDAQKRDGLWRSAQRRIASRLETELGVAL
jgi:uncharacterized protein (TIGR02646 family)